MRVPKRMSDTTFLPRPTVSKAERQLWPELASRGTGSAISQPRSAGDEAVLERLRAGDGAAVSELVERFHPTCRKLARALAHDDGQERHLTEEMLVGVLGRLKRSCHGDALNRLASRIATAIGIERAAGVVSSPGLSANGLDTEEEAFLREDTEEREDFTGDQGRIARRLFRKLLNGLPPEQRLVLSLIELEGWSLDEIAAQTGWPRWRARWRNFLGQRRLHRALVKLQSIG